MKYSSILNLFFFLMTAFLMPSCQDDLTATQQTETGGGLYISFDTPAATRSDLATEVAIKTLHAIYFVNSNNGVGDYIYYGYAACSPTTTAGVYKMTGYPTTADYPASTANYRIKVMFVANAAELFATTPSWTKNTTPIGTVEDELIIIKSFSGSATKIGIWGQSTEMGTSGAPMYVCTGEVGLIPVALTENLLLNNLDNELLPAQSDYKLTRMLAKFTINNRKALSQEAIAEGRYLFSLQKAQLIKGNDRGYLSSNKTDVPSAAVQSTTTNAYEMTSPANETIVVESANVNVEQIVFYAFPAINPKKDAADLSDRTDNCYILLQGTVNSTAATYMLPIAGTLDGDGTIITPGSIKRNTHYEYLIDGVNDKALEVVVSAVPWGEEEINASVEPDRKLNVSDLEISTSLTNLSTSFSRIYFWSNQPEVVVDEMGRDAKGISWDTSTKEYTVSDIFAGLGNGGSNIHYDPGTGTGYIDIVPQSQLGTDTYYNSIFINAGGLKREIRITLNHVQYPLTYDYVGTFHRMSQVGERVIVMSNTGDWTATVSYPTGGSSEEFVLLSTSRSIDVTLGTNTPGDAENYPVTDGEQTVSGTGNIYLRVGMASTTTENRYAKIQITGNSDNRNPRYIYVRQGENPDYLMNNDVARPLAVKFSPYNLTVRSFGGTATTAAAIIGSIQGTPARNYFTTYPSQAGCICQWGADVSTLRVYNPATPVATSIGPTYWALNWQDSTVPFESWSSLVATTETCPEGYHRPNDGSTSVMVSVPSFADSEMRQSLLANENNYTGNSVWGYYADGFFDRRAITTQESNLYSASTARDNNAVSAGNSHVAYVGRLFYNPGSTASLFFPAAGRRDTGDIYSSSSLNDVGHGYYWLSSSADATSGYYMSLGDDTSTSIGSLNRDYGMSVRCVENSAQP